MRFYVCALALFLTSISLHAQQSLTPDRWSFISKATCGVTEFLQKNPTSDGRGVLILILDTGVDMGVQGLKTTSLGTPKVIDVQDFSGGGDVRLQKAIVEEKNGRKIYRDAAKTVALSGVESLPLKPSDMTYFIGVFDERRLQNGDVPDVDGDSKSGTNFGVLVFKTADGAVAFVDTNADGNLADEKPIRSYKEKFDTFSFAFKPKDKPPVMTCALNIFLEKNLVVFHYDDGSHGSHVAGIAAGKDIFATPAQQGFDGIAPGAELISLKISDGAIGQLTTTGSMKRAYEYAAALSKSQKKPVVVNMSFGVPSELEGVAEMELYLDSLIENTPNLYVSVSNGNEGPGVSSTGLPAAAARAISVGALLNKDIARDGFLSAQNEHFIWNFSSRGGEVAKPDLVAPGSAYSTVPNHSGRPLLSGTSMASPYVAGSIAVLLSALLKEDEQGVLNGSYRQVVMKTALRAGALPLTKTAAYSELDFGAGVLNVPKTYETLKAYRASGFTERAMDYSIRTPSMLHGLNDMPAAYSRTIAPPATQELIVAPKFKTSTAQVEKDNFSRIYELRSTAAWLKPVQKNVVIRGDANAVVRVQYDSKRLSSPGIYTGKIIATAATRKRASNKTPEPEFELLNTVIVPHTFENNQSELVIPNQTLSAGEIRRYFFAVPEEASSVVFRIACDRKLPNDVTGAIINPKGKIVGAISGIGEKERFAQEVITRDLECGIYEVVVQASPSSEAVSTFSLEADMYRVKFSQVNVFQNTIRAKVVNSGDAIEQGNVSARINGYTKNTLDTIRAGGSVYRRPILLDPNDRNLLIRVGVSKEDYNKNTDVGMMLVDSAGRKLVSQNLESASETIRLPNPYDAPAQVFLEIHYGFASAGKFVRAAVEETHVVQPIALEQSGSGNIELAPFVVQDIEFLIPKLPSPPKGFYWRGELRYDDLQNQLRSYQPFLLYP